MREYKILLNAAPLLIIYGIVTDVNMEFMLHYERRFMSM